MCSSARAYVHYLVCMSSLLLQMRYANNSNYKNDTMIRKEVYVTKAIVDELRRILEDSEVSPEQA